MINSIINFYKNNENKILLFVLLCIAVFTHKEWFDINSTLFYGDWRNRSDEATREILNWGRGMWIGFYNLGEPNIQPFSNIYTFLWGFIGNYQLSVKITLLWPIAIGSLFSSYFLIQYFVKNNIIAFLGALFYGFNTYILIKSSAHLPIAAVYSIAPLIFLSLEKFLMKKNYFTLIIFSLLYSVGCMYEIRMMYILTWIFIFYFLFFYAKEWQSYIQYMVIFSVIILCLGAYFILPLLILDKNMISGLANRGLWGDDFFLVENAFTLFNWNWTGSGIATEFINQPIKWYAWFLPALAMISVIFIKRFKKIDQKRILFFLILLLIGIFFSKQSDAPFGGTYLWMYQNFPGFNLFRLANKFYIVLAIAYLGLLSYSLLFIFSIVRRIEGKILLYIIFSGYFLINALPLVTQEIGTLFVDRKKPTEYQQLENLIKNDPDPYFRTLWIPMYSQWGYYDNNYPKIAMWQVINKAYGNHDQLAPFSDYKPSINNFSNPLLYSSVLEKNFSQKLLNDLKIKYIILPKTLPKTEENIFPYAGDRDDYEKVLDRIRYLKKISIGEIDVYVNTQDFKYIDTFLHLYEIDEISNLQNYHSLLNNSNKYGFVLSQEAEDNKIIDIKSEKLGKVFNNITIKNGEILSDEVPRLDFTKKIFIVSNSEYVEIISQKIGDKLSFFFSTGGNNLFFKKKVESSLFQFTPYLFVKDKKIFIEYLGEIFPLKKHIGAIIVGEKISIYSSQFLSRIWSPQELSKKKVQDCHNYDNDPRINFSFIRRGNESLIQLSALRHDACISKNIILNKGEYVFSFAHKSLNKTGKAGFFISGIDVQKKKITSSQNWKKEYKKISVNKDNSNISLYIYAFEGVNGENKIQYKDLAFEQINKITEVSVPSPFPSENKKYNWEKIGKLLSSDTLLLLNSAVDVFDNGNFESGLWKKSVEDCNNYDNDQKIGLSLLKEGKEKIIELWAVRHNACTSKIIPVKASQEYLLEFMYKSPTQSAASYNIGFFNGESVSDIMRSSTEWKRYSKIISIPEDSLLTKLHIYSKESNKKKKNIVHYKNFSFTPLPSEINNYYYIQSNNRTNTSNPSVSFLSINPSLKKVSLSNIRNSFYLSLGESFHPQWKLKINNKNSSIFDFNFLPEKKHFSLNNIQNGWYIDINEYCKVQKICELNKDGSYSLEIFIEFYPNRYLFFGLIFSGFFLIFLLIILLFLYKNNKHSFS